MMTVWNAGTGGSGGIGWSGTLAKKIVDAVWRQECPFCSAPLAPKQGPYHRMTCGRESCERTWGWCPQQMRRNIMAEVAWRETVIRVLARQCAFCGRPAVGYLSCTSPECVHLLQHTRVDVLQELTWVLEREWPSWNGPNRGRKEATA